MKKIALGILIGAACFSAQAQSVLQDAMSSGTASFSNLVFSLEDLDLTDGVAPSLSATYYRGRTGCCGFYATSYSSYSQPDPNWRPASEASLTLGTNVLNALHPDFRAGATELAEDLFQFVLSQNTRLVITGELTAQSMGPDVGILRIGDLDPMYVSTVAKATSRVQLDGSTMTLSREDAGTSTASFSFMLESLTGPAVTHSLTLYRDVFAKSSMGQPVTAVPEPSTYALMGLGLAALLARRRLGSSHT